MRHTHNGKYPFSLEYTEIGEYNLLLVVEGYCLKPPVNDMDVIIESMVFYDEEDNEVEYHMDLCELKDKIYEEVMM